MELGGLGLLDPRGRRPGGQRRPPGCRRRGRRRAGRWRRCACSRSRRGSRGPAPVAARPRSSRACRGPPQPCRTAASFQPRSTASPTPVLSPCPPNGGLRCAASPARNTRPTRSVSTSCIRAVHGSVESTVASTASPTAASMSARPSRSPVSRSTPNAMIHQVPSRSSGPSRAGASGFTVQYCTAGPCRTRVGETRRAEHHAEVRAQRVLPDVARPDRLPHGAARTVAPEHVVGGDLLGAVRAGDPDGDLRRARDDVDHPPAERERDGVELGDGVAQQLLEDELRGLLPDLREPVALRGEPQHPGEARELPAGQRRGRTRRRRRTPARAAPGRAAGPRGPTGAGAPWSAR